jgi:fumarate reductase flavoprotein subunit
MSRNYDVIVVGGGLAGLAALDAAMRAGCSALLLEKSNDLGGSSSLSAGTFAFANTPLQERAGIVDGIEQLRTDILTAGRHKSAPELVDAYVRNQLAAYRWMCEMDVAFTGVDAGGGNSIPRLIHTDAARLIGSIENRLITSPACIMTGLRVRQLLKDSAGRISGVVAGGNAEDQVFRCSRGIVLASGGFSMSAEFVARFAPRQTKARAVGGRGNTGDGLAMALEVGASLRDMEYINGSFGCALLGGQPMQLYPMYLGAIAVNRHGERFINESLPYKELGDACLAQEGALAYQVFDETVLARSVQTPAYYDLKAALAGGMVLTARSLDGLCDKCDVPQQGLARTVADYNEHVADGRDSFGRNALPSGAPLTELATPPFYAFPCTVGLLGTYAGVAIDPSARVIDELGRPIPGLYAAGEVTGGFHGAGYVSGTALGKAVVFGLQAGRSAAQAL